MRIPKYVTQLQVGYAAASAGFGISGKAPDISGKGGTLRTNKEQLAIAIAVARAENTTLNLNAENFNNDGTVDRGIWQINSVHHFANLDLFKLYDNATAAYDVFNSQGWNAWTTYRKGYHIPYLPAARLTAARIIKNPKKLPKNDYGPNYGDLPGVLSPFPDPGSTITGGVTSMLDVAKSLLDILHAILSRDTWIRVAEVMGGGIFLLAGIGILARELGGRPGALGKFIPKGAK